jgi:hypothetical protein
MDARPSSAGPYAPARCGSAFTRPNRTRTQDPPAGTVARFARCRGLRPPGEATNQRNAVVIAAARAAAHEVPDAPHAAHRLWVATARPVGCRRRQRQRLSPAAAPMAVPAQRGLTIPGPSVSTRLSKAPHTPGPAAPPFVKRPTNGIPNRRGGLPEAIRKYRAHPHAGRPPIPNTGTTGPGRTPAPHHGPASDPDRAKH